MRFGMCFNLDTGEVTSIVGDQVVVKSATQPPKIGTTVYTLKGKVGSVSDIIGSVDKPYFIVKLNQNSKVNVGDKLMGGLK
ncbi:MAG: H/ACA ribonucleoprotein complex subunit GAR1/NAF1 [Candidatus Altiarchaeota archaeon]